MELHRRLKGEEVGLVMSGGYSVLVAVVDFGVDFVVVAVVVEVGKA